MINIYCIQDINDLKYVGSTEQTLDERLKKHINNKNVNVNKKNAKCSSEKLDLNKCKIISLETCDKLNRKQRERYWINNTNCVNELKLNYVKKDYNKIWDQENRMFRWKRVTNGCYEFVKMLEEY
tara:strand:- start:139 stop:513 length:375 start_codon:yes stop_codon:yes gene_type:complete